MPPLAHAVWPGPEHAPSVLRAAAQGGTGLLHSLFVVWSFAAFGEEMGYRGYLLDRALDLAPRSWGTTAFALTYSAVLFGFGHYFKGPAGVAASTFSGLVLGALYLLTKRNLWASILAHGLRDTLAIVLVATGWAN